MSIKSKAKSIKVPNTKKFKPYQSPHYKRFNWAKRNGVGLVMLVRPGQLVVTSDRRYAIQPSGQLHRLTGAAA